MPFVYLIIGVHREPSSLTDDNLEAKTLFNS